MDNEELFIALKDMFNKKVEEVKETFDIKIEEVKKHTGALVENLHRDIKAVAEGHIDLNKKMDTMQKDMAIIKDYVIAVDIKLNEHDTILKRVK